MTWRTHFIPNWISKVGIVTGSSLKDTFTTSRSLSMIRTRTLSSWLTTWSLIMPSTVTTLISLGRTLLSQKSLFMRRKLLKPTRRSPMSLSSSLSSLLTDNSSSLLSKSLHPLSLSSSQSRLRQEKEVRITRPVRIIHPTNLVLLPLIKSSIEEREGEIW